MANRDESGPRTERYLATSGESVHEWADEFADGATSDIGGTAFVGTVGRACHRDTTSGNQSASQSASQLMLSVFLLLLAFFVVLVTLTEDAVDREGIVMSSLDQTFGRTMAPVPMGPLISEDADHAQRRDDLTSALSRYPEIKVGPLRDEDLESLLIVSPPREFFEEPRPVVRRDRSLLLGRMAGFLRSNLHGGARLTVLIETPEERLADAAREAFSVRLEALRAKLVELGTPGEIIELGVAHADATAVRLELSIDDTAGKEAGS